MKIIKALFGLLKGADLILHSLEKLMVLEQTLLQAVKEAKDAVEADNNAIAEIKAKQDKHNQAIGMAENAIGLIKSITKVENKN